MSDQARLVLTDPRAPAAERAQAQAEMERPYQPLTSQLIPSADIQKVIAYAQDGLMEADMMKGADILTFPERGRKPKKTGMQSVYIDDLQIFQQGEYFEKPAPMGFDALRTMVDQTPTLSAILLTRQRQVSRFCQPSDDGGLGFEIRAVDRKAKKGSTDPEAMALLTKFFQHCGWEWSPRKRKSMHRDSFTQFMMKSVRDSLTMDACPIETEMKRDKSLGIDGMYAVDGATIRLCTEEGYEGDDSIYALQVVQGRVVTAYTYEQLIYEVRNPRTDVRLAGYGMGETELLIRVVTGLLNAMTYNISGFDQNAIPRGMMTLVGDYASEDVVAFRRYWNSTVKGINNAWAMPVMVARDKDSKATFEKFDADVDEMMYSKWMVFLVSVACAIYGMDPAEISSESFSASGKSGLAGDDTEEKLANSKDKGLRPLMSFYEAMFTDFVVTDFADKYCFRWVGLDSEDEDKLFEKQKLVLRVDELRAELGYEPDPDYGDAPLNPALAGVWQAKNMPQPEQPAQEGEPAPDFGKPAIGHNGGPPMDDAPDQASPDQPAPDGAPQPAAAAPSFGGDDDKPEGDFGKALSLAAICTMGA